MKKILKNSAPAVFLFTAVLLSAIPAYSACTDNYKACRCRQWNGSNLSSLSVTLNDCCSLKQNGCDVSANFTDSGTTAVQGSGSSVSCKTPCPSTCTSGTRNTSVSYSEDGSCCTTAANDGKVYLTSTNVRTYTSNSVLNYATDSSVCNSYCDSSYITTAKADSSLSLNMCSTANYSSGVTPCTKSSFTSCYLSDSFNTSASAGGGPPVDTCIVPGHATYGNCNNAAFKCSGGCTKSGNTWTCKDNGANVTFQQALATGTQPLNCYAYQCLCNVTASYVTCI